jgi:hypothetical protein
MKLQSSKVVGNVATEWEDFDGPHADRHQCARRPKFIGKYQVWTFLLCFLAMIVDGYDIQIIGRRGGGN